MIPYYFGSSAQPLFGVYHPPPPNQAKNIGVVLCYPLGHEYLRGHRAFRQLADMLAESGCHVLRFDYTGTGDSWGELNDTSVEQWQQDIEVAIQELRDMAQVQNISLLGLRFGATLASLITKESLKINKLILWDPIIKGTRYIEDLKALHLAKLIDPMLYDSPRTHDTGNDFNELVGFPVPRAMQNSIMAIDLITTEPQLSVKQCIMLVSDEDKENLEYFERNKSLLNETDYIVVEEATALKSVNDTDILIPVNSLTRIISLLE